MILGDPRAKAQCSYDVTITQGPWCNDIFEFPPTLGRGLNDLGTVVGSYRQCDIGPSQAFAWTAGAGFVILQRPEGYNSAAARDVRDDGTVVGVLGVPTTDGPYAALWQDGDVLELGTLPGGDFSRARAVNSLGQVVGEWGNEDFGPIHGFVWEAGVMKDLGPVLGAHSSHAVDISDLGAIVGWLRESLGDDEVAYLVEEEVVTVLGHIPGGFRSRATALNTAGDVVGLGIRLDQETGGTVTRPFLWSDGEMSDLGTLPGFKRSAARDINDGGDIVGDSWHVGDNQDISDAFVWQDGVMRSLNALISTEIGVHITNVTSVNKEGQITGWAATPTGIHAILLTPVAQPMGDLDGDCVLASADVEILLASWGPCDECTADLDSDGSVGVLDLLLMLASDSW